ncbi:ATP-dependent DNA helicase RecG [Pseudobutyrivibrio sp. YE44]|uniref:ATP-binding protein n=1 Tax=Pseudobutyrivibrio sp. YE44 TaxID=1520802 RepID=UPI0008857BBC|nr:ATP-binding protein [Pseudobutyrivibrio sp. YE44]SDB28873.1 ATP-dependent DNA helicase RecG [Pseudobutyrivibrio sp. YE44]
MTKEEFIDLLNEIKSLKCENRILELKAAREGCPKKLYDTLSSFSNQDDGGVIIFGIDETNNYEECGVYDINDLQKQVNNQCLQMEPIIRPVLTELMKEGKFFLAAEIPAVDIVDRPCFYKGAGKIKGSYIRVGDSDERMTEYEIYSFEAYRKKYLDDIRPVERAKEEYIDKELLDEFIRRIRKGKPNLEKMPDEVVENLFNIKKDGFYTISSVFTFCHFPQAFYPQLSIHAIVVPGKEIGDSSIAGVRFIDNQNIEGNIVELLEGAVSFVLRNMKNSVLFNSNTGERVDKPEYPIIAIREAILNALVHRDYSIHTEGKPIQLVMYEDRLEISNPGGLYGRITVDQLGKIQPDTRNPVLVKILETMGVTENRYSGIPTIKTAIKDFGLREPVFEDRRGSFVVTFSNHPMEVIEESENHIQENTRARILEFLEQERTRKEIAQFLNRESVTYAIHRYIDPLIESGDVKMTIPNRPSSKNQRYVRVKS